MWRTHTLTTMIFTGMWLMGFAWAQQEVTLYTENGYRGKSEIFTGDDPNLKNNYTGNDSANSIAIPRGCTVILYEHANFEGRCITLRRSTSNLGKTPLGNNQASSIRIVWGQDNYGPSLPERRYPEGVTLFAGDRYEGRSETFTEDVPNLKDSIIGNDQVNSLRVSPGWEVILYEHKNFRGRREIFSSSDPQLKDNHMGNNRASSLRVRRLSGSSRTRADREEVTLYQHPEYQGRSQQVTGDITNLKGSKVGNDQVSSLYIPEGWRVILYSGKNFTGPSETFDCSDPDLHDNWIGDNKVSSVKLIWVGYAIPTR